MIVFKSEVLSDDHRRDISEWIINMEHLSNFDGTGISEDTSRKAFAVTFKTEDLPERLDFLKDNKTNIYNIVGIVTYNSGDIPEHIDDDFVWYMKEIQVPEMYIKHPSTTCVYYAEIPQSMKGGETIFKCENTITAPPEQNSMVEFSSNIPHSVTAMEAKGPRVVLVCEKYKLLRPALQHITTPIYREG